MRWVGVRSVASPISSRRIWGSRPRMWIAWALHDEAYALIALQIGLFALNVRGVRKNDPELR